MSEKEGKAVEANKEPKRGVGSVAMEAIKAGKTNEEALALVQKEFPEAKTSLASINWYRNKLRADGHAVPTARDLKPKKEDPVKAEAATAKVPHAHKQKDPLD